MLAGTQVTKEQIVEELRSGKRAKPVADDMQKRPRFVTQDEDEEEDEDDAEERDPDDKHGLSKAKKSKAGDEDEEEDDEEEDEDDEEEEEDEEEDDEEEDGEAKELAPDAARRLAVSQRQAAARQAALARERERAEAEIAKKRAEIEKEKEAASSREAALKRRIDIDPIGALEELTGKPLDEKALEYLAQQAFHRAKGSADPAHKEAAARALRERELRKANDDLRERLDKLESKHKEEIEAIKVDSGVQSFFSEVEESLDETAHPLTSRLWASSKASARAALTRLAVEYHEKHGRAPSPEKLVRLFERRRRNELAAAERELAELKKAGISLQKIAGGKPLTKAKPSGKSEEKHESEDEREDMSGKDPRDLSLEEKKIFAMQALKRRKSE